MGSEYPKNVCLSYHWCFVSILITNVHCTMYIFSRIRFFFFIRSFLSFTLGLAFPIWPSLGAHIIIIISFSSFQCENPAFWTKINADSLFYYFHNAQYWAACGLCACVYVWRLMIIFFSISGLINVRINVFNVDFWKYLMNFERNS